MSKRTIFTIGHSTQPIDGLIGLLRKYGVSAICDIRSSPYSRFNPQFNRETLKSALKEAGIAYVFLGEELGARSKDPACYRDGKVSYELLAKTQAFRDGIERVKKGAETYTVALMCAEKDPLQCHRTILVARNLAKEGIEVSHILADGGVEPQKEVEERLLYESGETNTDFFLSHDQLLDQAYEKRGAEIAYEDENAIKPDDQEAVAN